MEEVLSFPSLPPERHLSVRSGFLRNLIANIDTIRPKELLIKLHLLLGLSRARQANEEDGAARTSAEPSTDTDSPHRRERSTSQSSIADTTRPPLPLNLDERVPLIKAVGDHFRKIDLESLGRLLAPILEVLWQPQPKFRKERSCDIGPKVAKDENSKIAVLAMHHVGLSNPTKDSVHPLASYIQDLDTSSFAAYVIPHLSHAIIEHILYHSFRISVKQFCDVVNAFRAFSESKNNEPFRLLTPKKQASLFCFACESIIQEGSNCDAKCATQLALTIGPPREIVKPYPFDKMEAMITALASLGCRAVGEKSYETAIDLGDYITKLLRRRQKLLGESERSNNDTVTVGNLWKQLQEFINNSLSAVETHGAELKSTEADKILRIMSTMGIHQYIPFTAYVAKEDEDWGQYLDLNLQHSGETKEIEKKHGDKAVGVAEDQETAAINSSQSSGCIDASTEPIAISHRARVANESDGTTRRKHSASQEKERAPKKARVD